MDAVTVVIPATHYVYEVLHREREGDCDIYDHGPRPVAVDAFAMDVFPVTNAMFYTFLVMSRYVPADPRNFLRHWSGDAYPMELANHPVVWVSPDDARAYAEWAGKRLPRDVEWQLAAAGSDRRPWPWGSVYEATRCNGSGTRTTPVNRYPEGRSQYGVYDLCGNVWEWMDDVVDDGWHRWCFIRGGSYYRADHRSGWYTEGGPQPCTHHLKFLLMGAGLNRCATVGFRCVKEIVNANA